MNKTQIVSMISAAIFVIFGFMFSSTFISKADCMNMINNSIQEHEQRDEMFQEQLNKRLDSIQMDIREIRKRV